MKICQAGIYTRVHKSNRTDTSVKRTDERMVNTEINFFGDPLQLGHDPSLGVELQHNFLSECLISSLTSEIHTLLEAIYGSAVLSWSGFEPWPGTSCCVLGQDT